MSGELQLRDAVADDGGAIAAIYAPFVRETAVSFEVEVPTAEELARRIAAVQGTHAWLVGTVDGALAGWAYGTRFRGRAAYDWTVETAVYVSPTARRRGLGLRLGGALAARLEGLGYRSAVAGITLPNDPSRALHRALGYRPAGTIERAGWKFDRWHAIEFWTRSLGVESPNGPPGA